MKAAELFLSSMKSAGVWYCGECRIVHRTEEQAEKCCRPYKCHTCGIECTKYWNLCDGCRTANENAKEAARFEAAEKVTSWGGWIYCEGLGNEGFAESVEELMDDCSGPEDELPAYVWTCDPVPFARISLDNVLQQIAENENAYEDFEADSLAGIPELKQAIEAFNEANRGVLSHQPNYKRALVIKSEPRQAAQSEVASFKSS